MVAAASPVLIVTSPDWIQGPYFLVLARSHRLGSRKPYEISPASTPYIDCITSNGSARTAVQGRLGSLERSKAHYLFCETTLEPQCLHKLPSGPSSLTVPPPSEDIVKSYDPVARSKSRKGELPPSRYGYHYKAGSYCLWTVALTLSI